MKKIFLKKGLALLIALSVIIGGLQVGYTAGAASDSRDGDSPVKKQLEEKEDDYAPDKRTAGNESIEKDRDVETESMDEAPIEDRHGVSTVTEEAGSIEIVRKGKERGERLLSDTNSGEQEGSGENGDNTGESLDTVEIVEGTCGSDINWSFDEQTGLLDIEGTGNMFSYGDSSSIPWKDYSDKITKITIQDGITSIGMYVFSGLKYLNSVDMTDDITSIGFRAFYNCTNLTEINIPAKWSDCPTSSEGNINATYCGHIFEGCQSLTDIAIPEGMTELPSYALCKSDYLETVQLPDTLTAIKNHTFYECTRLKEVSIPQKVQKIGKSAFCYDRALPDIEIKGAVTELEMFAFYSCTSLKKAVLPDSIEKIGYQAFANCSGLSEINIPSSWKECPTANTSGSVDSDGCGHIFEGCAKLKSVSVPEGMEKLPGFAFAKCNYLEEVILPGTVAEISNHVFYDCSMLKSVKIPAGIKDIGKSAFCYCSSLETVTLPDGLTELALYAFYSCKALEKIALPDSIERLGYQTFADCTKLSDINIPVNWKECPSSKESDSGTEYQGNIFSGCTNLYQIILPNQMKRLPSYAFCNCNTIREIYLPNSLTELGEYSFYGCSSLTSVNLPSGVSTIPNSAFANCSSLLVVNVPEAVKSVETRAFSNCNSLNTINYQGKNTGWSQISISNTGNSSIEDITINYDFHVSYSKEDILGVWEGEYDGNSGSTIVRRHFVLRIEDCEIKDNRGRILGSVTISPSEKGTSEYDANGSYRFSGTVNMLTGVFFYQGHTWIEYPEEYDNFGFVTFDGLFEAGKTTITGINEKTSSRTFDADLLGSSKVTNTSVIMSVDGEKYDLLEEKQSILHKSSKNVTITVLPDWDGAENGIIRIFQSDVSVESKTGSFLDIQPGMIFSPSKSIFVSLIDSAGKTVETKKLKLSINPDTQNRGTLLTKTTRLTIYQNQYESNNDRDKYKVCKGASVICGEKTYTSNAKGIVSIPTISEGSIKVEKEGYVSRVLTSRQIHVSSVINLQKKSENCPVISAVWVNDNSDVLKDTYSLNMVSREKVTIKAEVDWGSRAYRSIRLVQDSKSVEFSDDILTTVISDNFNTSQTIYIVAEDQDGRVSKKALQFENGTTSKVLASLDGAKFDFSSKINVTLPDTVPDFFKNVKISAGVSSIVPITLSADDGKVYVAIGADLKKYKYSDSTESGNVAHVLKGKTKKFIKEFKETGVLNGKDASKSIQKLKNFKQTYNKAIKYPQGSFGFEADFTLLGFAEGCFSDSGDITWLDGGIILNPSISAKYDYPFTITIPIGPIILPMYFETAMSANILGQLNIRFNEAAKNFVPIGQVKGDISLSGGVGVGIKKVLYAGGGLEGKLKPDWKIVWGGKDHFKLTATVNAYAKAGIACFEGKKNFDPVYNKVWIEVPKASKSKTGEFLDGETLQNSSLFNLNDASAYGLKDLSYLDRASEFTANNVGRGRKARAANASTENTASTVFKTNVYRESTPELVSWKDGRQLAVWPDAQSGDANKIQLYYSYFDGNIWSTPKAVCEDGTMDYSPMLAVIDDTAYLTWQNAAKSFDLTDNVTLGDISDFDISVAKFDPGKGFTSTTIKNDNLDMMPYLCGNGDNIYVVWCNNGKNDWFGDNADNSIFYSKVTDISCSEPVQAYEKLNSLYSMSADYDTELKIAYSMDEDGDTATAEDIWIYENGIRVSTSESPESSPEYLNHRLYWYSGNLIVNKKGSISGGTIPTDRYEILTIGNKDAVVFAESDGLGSALKISYLNEEENSWGEALVISDNSYFTGAFSAVEGADGSLKIIANQAEITGDYEADDPYGNSSLVMVTSNPVCNLTLSDVLYEEDTFCSGGPMEFNFTLTNNGTVPIYRTIAEIRDKDGQVLSTMHIEDQILPGDSIEAGTYFTVEGNEAEQKVVLSVLPEEISDADSSDNSEEINLSYEKLFLENLTYGEMENGKYNISADIVNRGYKDQSNVRVSLVKDSETGKTVETQIVETVASMDIHTVSFEIPARDGDIYYVVINPEENSDSFMDSDFVRITEQEIHDHVWNEGEILSHATCTKKGEKKYICTICGEEKIEEIPAKGSHSYGAWKVIKESSAIVPGIRQRVCSSCGNKETAAIAKLAPKGKLNMKTIPLKVKQSTTLLKATGLAKGDRVKSYKVADTRIAKVSSKGKITARKKGKTKLTVTLASGKKLTAKVTVQKGTVKTKKITVNRRKIELKKGKKFKVKTTLTPLTSQQKITYTITSGKKVVKVSKGIIKGVKKGKAVIAVKSGSKKLKIRITVK